MTDVSNISMGELQILSSTVKEYICNYLGSGNVSHTRTKRGDILSFQRVSSPQYLSTSYQQVQGSLLYYRPPIGTKTVIFEYHCQLSVDPNSNTHALSSWRAYFDGNNEVTNARRAFGADHIENVVVMRVPLQLVDGADDYANGKINKNTWNSQRYFSIYAREFSTTPYSHQVALHRTRWWDGQGNWVFCTPTISIIALG